MSSDDDWIVWELRLIEIQEGSVWELFPMQIDAIFNFSRNRVPRLSEAEMCLAAIALPVDRKGLEIIDPVLVVNGTTEREDHDVVRLVGDQEPCHIMVSRRVERVDYHGLRSFH